jgi:uncharacterized integral membrane protein
MKARIITTLILLLFVAIFLLQNASVVGIRLLIWEVEMPRSLLIFIMFFIGAVVGWFARAMYRISRTRD